MGTPGGSYRDAPQLPHQPQWHGTGQRRPWHVTSLPLPAHVSRWEARTEAVDHGKPGRLLCAANILGPDGFLLFHCTLDFNICPTNTGTKNLA